MTRSQKQEAFHSNIVLGELHGTAEQEASLATVHVQAHPVPGIRVCHCRDLDRVLKVWQLSSYQFEKGPSLAWGAKVSSGTLSQDTLAYV